MESPYNVLFLCTGNSARSILAEALLNGLGRGRFRGFSAGSHPAGQVNPYALMLVEQNQLPIAGLRSKSWNEFSGPDAPPMHFVFTVCDNAAAESCPYWFGAPMTAHWGLADPAAVVGSDEAKRQAFRNTFIELKRRITLFLALPHEKLDGIILKAKLDEIGRAQ